MHICSPFESKFMIDENIYKVLITSIARDMPSLNKNFYRSLEKLRKKIIQTHRSICLLPYYIYIIDSRTHQQKHQSYLPNLSNLELIETLFKPQESPLYPEISMIAQDASFLINHLENNFSEFVKGIIDLKGTIETIDYYHLIFQIVPSLFGYFHSNEHLNLATKFYQNVIDLISDNPADSIRILQPFLSTPATYRYIEYVMTNFFTKIVIFKPSHKNKYIINDDDSLIDNEYVMCINNNTKELLHYLTKGVSLLPDQVLQIFRQIKTKYNDKWTIQNWYKLIFSIFIIPHATRWARSHFFNIDQNLQSSSKNQSKCYDETAASYSLIPYLYQTTRANVNSPSKASSNKMDQLNHILKNVMNENLRNELDNFLNALCTVKSSYRSPEMYKCFSNYSTQYYMLINDLIIFVDLLKSRKILPSFIKYDLIHEIPQKYRNVVFYIKVYKSTKLTKAIDVNHPILFPLTVVKTEIIERYEKQPIEYKAKLASLESTAENFNKDPLTFSLEKSVCGKEFHQYVSDHVYITLTNLADQFENYIEDLRLFNEIEKWRDLSLSCQNFLFIAYSQTFVKMPTVFELLPKKVKLLSQLSIIEEQKLHEKLNSVTAFSGEWDRFIHRISLNFQEKNQSCQNVEIQGITQKQLNLIQNENIQPISNISHSNSIDIKPMKFIEKIDSLAQLQQLPLYFLRALSIFTQLPVVSLPEKYELLMEFLSIIEEFFPKDDNSLYFLLIQRIPGSILLKIFIEISIVVIHDNLCFNFISNIEKSRWQRLENLIYETASKNDAMFKKILNAQIEFQKAYDLWKNSFFNNTAKRNRRFSLIG